MGKLSRRDLEETLSTFSGYNGAKGSIVRLKVEDFMTYRNVEMKAGPHVNLIMGPNGTGKSTIVCAICLGLAGKPKILGRAHSLKEYIRHGAHRASVEIELFNPDSVSGTGSNWVVKRVLDDSHSGSTSTEWFINERKCRENQVEKLMKSLNIQLDNLCQFLPQDRVQDFAKMDSIQLLRSTEQSIDNDHGDHLGDKHEQLIQLKNDIADLRKRLKNSDQSLRIEIQHNVQLENEVRAFQDRERMEKEIQELEGTKLWLLYQLAVNQFSEVKKRCEEKDKKIKKEENLLAPRQKELDLIKSKLVHHREEMNKLKSECMKRVDQCKRQYQDTCDSVESQLDTLKGQFDAAERREHDRARRLSELRERINGLKRELEESIQRGDDNYEDLNQRLQELENQKSTITNKMCELNAMDDSDRGDLRLAHNQIRAKELELNSMSDFRSSRMKFLERIDPQLARAVEYFSDPTNLQNAHFRGNIHEPMILFIYVNDLQYGKVAEICVPRPDLLAFFVEEKEDMKRLMAICKDKNFRISCIHHQMHPQFQKPPANWFSEETMRAFDFQKNLVDLIEAPDYYMSYLCKTVKPQDVLIGTQKTERAAKEIINNTNLRSFYTLNYMYVVRTSSYTGEKNSSINYINPARIFTDQINAAERESVQTELDRAKKDAGRLERQMERRKPMLQELSQKTQEIEKIKMDINTRMTNNKRIRQQLENEERRYRNVEEEKVDLVEMRRQHRIKILEAKRGQEQALVRYNKNMNDITLKYVNMLVHTQQSSVLHSAYTRKQRILEEAKETLQILLAELRELDANKARVADLAKRRKTDAMNKTKEKSAPENVRNGLVHEEELETEINRLQAQLNFLPDTDADVIRDYQARKRRIEDMEKSKEDLEETLRQLEVDMEEGKRTWLEPLKELIGRINSNFGRFFANMQCVGEVSLDHAEDENDFSKYGVKIKVKFRASEPLVELCGWKQSGGERAITTALYILALQELTKVPFRVIDEINQGMDAKNEARFFQLLCTLAQGEDTPQYFLLTPKLLPPVEYPDNVDFHLIFNGPHVDVSKNSITVAEDHDDGSLVADDDNDVDNESNVGDVTTDED